jgi:hypothetical protein
MQTEFRHAGGDGAVPAGAQAHRRSALTHQIDIATRYHRAGQPARAGGQQIWPVLADLYDRKLIEAQEFLRLVYRMTGETYELKAPAGIRREVQPADESKVVNDPGEEDG